MRKQTPAVTVRRLAYLAGDPVRTELPEAQRRRDLPEQGDHVHVLDPPLGIWIILRPQPHELVQMVGT